MLSEEILSAFSGPVYSKGVRYMIKDIQDLSFGPYLSYKWVIAYILIYMNVLLIHNTDKTGLT